MVKKKLTLTSNILLYLLAADEVLSPWMNAYALRNKVLFGNSKSYKGLLYKLQRRGLIKLVDKNAQRFIKLTQKGELEGLFIQADYLTGTIGTVNGEY